MAEERPSAGAAAPPEPSRTALRELALLFLRLGLTAFGGPAAHVAMMQDEVVRRRGWLTTEELLDFVGATNLIPGPNSTELAIHIGHKRGGWRGLVVAGVCFIVPAALLSLGLAWFYVRYGKLPEARAILYGVKPVIIAVVAQALVALGRAALKNRLVVAIGVAATVASLLHVDELVVLFGGGAAAMLGKPSNRLASGAPVAAIAGVLPAVSAGASPSSLFLAFAKIGSVLFGSGYVLLAFLRADFVERRGWLSEGQLIDAVAVGQVTPGPVFSTATFIGYLVAGLGGAAASTAGIFLPAFVFVALSGIIVPRLRRSPRASLFLDGVNVASLALMAVVTLDLTRAALVDAPACGLAALSALLLFRFEVSSAWLVLGGAAAGLALSFVR
ncbi:MAG: chromate efflux transporter [Labilithrix sp.]|nr:chromate efflux transporter [Labilithrix sp.]